MHLFPVRFATVVSVSLIFAATGFSQILTGKPEFIKRLEAGEPQRLSLVGTSMVSCDHSFWSCHLQELLSERFGTYEKKGDTLPKADVYSSVGLARGGTTSREALTEEKTGIFNNLRKRPANAIAIEYAWTDTKNQIPLEESRSNISELIDLVRDSFPGTEIIMYQTGLAAVDKMEAHPNLVDYLDLCEQIAKDKQTYFVPTLHNFQAKWDSLEAEGTLDQEWIKWVYDGHHPSDLAARKLIIPEWEKVLFDSVGTGIPDPTLSVALDGARRLFFPGDTVALQLVHEGIPFEGLTFQISTDGGESYQNLKDFSQTSQGAVWELPTDISISESYRIRISPPIGDAVITQAFAIRQRNPDSDILTIHPLSQSSYQVGDTMKISWTLDPDLVSSVVVDISYDHAASFVTLGSSPSEGYNWRIPSLLPVGLDGVQPTQTDSLLIRISNYTEPYAPTISSYFSIQTANHLRPFGKIRSRLTGAGKVYGIDGKLKQSSLREGEMMFFPDLAAPGVMVLE